MDIHKDLDRRDCIKLTASAGIAVTAAGKVSDQKLVPTRAIPARGEQLPIIGLGTSDEFEVIPANGSNELKAVIAKPLEHGGSIIDTAPTYGNAETVLGQLLGEMGTVRAEIRTRHAWRHLGNTSNERLGTYDRQC